jgi:hypothetical protein
MSSWNTACPAWEDRILSGRSLVPHFQMRLPGPPPPENLARTTLTFIHLAMIQLMHIV